MHGVNDTQCPNVRCLFVRKTHMTSCGHEWRVQPNQDCCVPSQHVIEVYSRFGAHAWVAKAGWRMRLEVGKMKTDREKIRIAYTIPLRPRKPPVFDWLGFFGSLPSFFLLPIF